MAFFPAGKDNSAEINYAKCFCRGYTSGGNYKTFKITATQGLQTFWVFGIANAVNDKDIAATVLKYNATLCYKNRGGETFTASMSGDEITITFTVGYLCFSVVSAADFTLERIS